MAFRVLEEIPGSDLSPRPEDALDPRPLALANAPMPGGGPTQTSTGFRLTGEVAPEPPRAPGPLMSSPGGFFGPGLLANIESRLTGKTPEQAYGQRVPQLERAAAITAPLVVPGAGSLLGNVGRQALVGGGLGALTGAQGGVGGAAQRAAGGAIGGAAGAAAGEGLMRAGRLGLSAIPFKSLQERTGTALKEYLERQIPIWHGLGEGPRGLWEMAHGAGQQKLDVMFKAAKATIPAGLMTEIPEEVAKRIGSKETNVAVSQLVDKLSTLKGADHRAAWDAIDSAIGPLANPALQAARNQYRLGMGWIEFANKGKFLSDTTKGFDLLKAQKALGAYGRKSLLGRGMEQPFRAIQGQGAITPQRIGIPTGLKMGPMPLQIPLGTGYRGLPQGPLSQAIQGLLGRGGAAGAGAAVQAAGQPQETEE